MPFKDWLVANAPGFKPVDVHKVQIINVALAYSCLVSSLDVKTTAEQLNFRMWVIAI